MTKKEKTILFLIQSCNKQHYIDEENFIKSTWGKDVLDEKYPGVDLLFYKGDGDDSIKGDTLYLNEDDGLFHTYEKTVQAIGAVLEQYDYIIRTNTSIYCNVPNIIHNVRNNFQPKKLLYIGGNLVANKDTENIPFIRGNFLVLNKTAQKAIVDSYGLITNTGIDDINININLAKYCVDNNINYFSILKQIPNVKYDDNFSNNNLKDLFYVRLTDFNKKHEKQNILNPIFTIHSLNNNQITEIKPNDFKEVETSKGLLPWNPENK